MGALYSCLRYERPTQASSVDCARNWILDPLRFIYSARLIISDLEISAVHRFENESEIYILTRHDNGRQRVKLGEQIGLQPEIA
jgi:hypothetical protein